jgi:hypothetical protein
MTYTITYLGSVNYVRRILIGDYVTIPPPYHLICIPCIDESRQKHGPHESSVTFKDLILLAYANV